MTNLINGWWVFPSHFDAINSLSIQQLGVLPHIDIDEERCAPFVMGHVVVQEGSGRIL
jgi:hypothetical protein